MTWTCVIGIRSIHFNTEEVAMYKKAKALGLSSVEIGGEIFSTNCLSLTLDAMEIRRKAITEPNKFGETNWICEHAKLHFFNPAYHKVAISKVVVIGNSDDDPFRIPEVTECGCKYPQESMPISEIQEISLSNAKAFFASEIEMSNKYLPKKTGTKQLT